LKSKDLNIILAAVAVLVTLKTLLNGKKGTFEVQENADEDEPIAVSDLTYEYLNDALHSEQIDFENLDFMTLMRHLQGEFKEKAAFLETNADLRQFLSVAENEQEGKDSENKE
jgi:hypothetical protein